MIKAKPINEINCNTELSQLQKQCNKDNDRLTITIQQLKKKSKICEEYKKGMAMF